MIEYNPKAWFTFIFQFHRADTFLRLFPMMLCIAAYCGLVEYVEVQYFHLTDASRVRNVSIVHTLLGLALSMLLVFRTNTAYDRWWEARKLWGSLVNSSRSLAIQIAALIPAGPDRTFLCNALATYPVVVLVFYALASLELIAEEIENPFGTDPNDLPLESICETIRKSVVEILGEGS